MLFGPQRPTARPDEDEELASLLAEADRIVSTQDPDPADDLNSLLAEADAIIGMPATAKPVSPRRARAQEAVDIATRAGITDELNLESMAIAERGKLPLAYLPNMRPVASHGLPVAPPPSYDDIVAARQASKSGLPVSAPKSQAPLETIRPVSSHQPEGGFDEWYANMAARHDLNPDPDATGQLYDYRAAFAAGAAPDETGHWPSQFKRAGHPNEVVGGFNTRTGERVPGTPRASEAELVASGWDPATAAQLARTPEPGMNPMRPLASHGKALDPMAPVTSHDPANIEEMPDPTMGERLTDVGITALKGAIGVPETAVGWADLVSGGRAGQAAAAMGFDPGLAKEILSRYYSRAQQQAFQNVGEADGVLETIAAALSNPSVIGHTVLESAPSMLAGGAAARVLPVAPWLAGAIGEGVVTAGSAAEQTRQQSETGLLTPQQAALAVASGVGTSALGAFGGRLAKRLGIADVDTLLAGAARSPEAQRGLVRQIAMSATQEGFLEELPQSVQEQILQNAAQGRPLDEGVDQAAVLGVFAGAVMGGGAQVVSRLGARGLPVSDPVAAPQPVATPVDEETDLDTLLAQADDIIGPTPHAPGPQSADADLPALLARADEILGGGTETPLSGLAEQHVQEGARARAQGIDVPRNPVAQQLEQERQTATADEIPAVLAADDATRRARAAEQGSAVAATPVQAAPGAPTAGEFYTMRPDEIAVDPSRFQFKAGGNKEGVTSTAKIDGPWNEARAGVLMVWKDPADQKTYVVNGHHRLDAAKRLGAERVAVRYLEAPDAATARVEGALTNISEDKGTPLDAAKLIRDAGFEQGDLVAAGLSPKSALVRDGIGLAALSDPLFARVVSGEIDEKVGGAIGSAGLSPEGQAAVSQLVDRQQGKGRVLTPAQVRVLAQDVASTPEVKADDGGQADIFGLMGEERTQNVAVEKAVLRDWARQQLAQDKRLFGFVAKDGRADALARGGNTIDVASSKAIADEAGQVAAVFDRLAGSAGPVSSALNAAAVRMAEGTPSHEVRTGLLADLRSAVAAELGRPASKADGGAKGAGVGVAQEAHRQRRAPDPQPKVTGADRPPREFASTQVNLPDDVGRELRALGTAIPDSDLAEDGRENDPHVTVKFGLHADTADDVRALLASEPPITVRFGKTSFFPNRESNSGDVLKVDVDSPDLHRLNKKIAAALPNTDTHPTYTPHATVAYLKEGLGKKYAGADALAGREITIDRIVFSGKDRTNTVIPLGGAAAAASTTTPKGLPVSPPKARSRSSAVRGEALPVRPPAVAKSRPDVQPGAYSKNALQDAFNLTDEQAAATDALVEAMGLDTGRLQIAKGGTPGVDALDQEDLLDTGERQPRLPEAGDVRDREVSTPLLAEPEFRLTSEVAKPKKVEQPTLFQAPETPFYSRLIRAVEDSKQAKASGAQWKATVRNAKTGISQDEFALVGVQDLQDATSYTREEVLDYLRLNQVAVDEFVLGAPRKSRPPVAHRDITIAQDEHQWIATTPDGREVRIGKGTVDGETEARAYAKRYLNDLEEEADGEHQRSNAPHFSSYQLGGAQADSYREVLLTAPGRRTWLNGDRITPEDTATPHGRAAADRVGTYANAWHDGHDQYRHVVNPVVRLRFNVRDLPGDTPRTVLFLEEVQAPSKANFAKMPTLFQKHWRDLAFKWAIRHAAERGYDGVAWTTGEQQAERYDLSKQIASIDWRPNLHGQPLVNNGVRSVRVVRISPAGEARPIQVGVDADGLVMSARDHDQWIGKAFGDVVGKEVADRIMADESGELSGTGLQIGGEGLRKLYDVDFKNVVQGLPAVKKHGGRVASVPIEQREPGLPLYDGPDATLEQAREVNELSRQRGNVWVSPITGERQSAVISRVDVNHPMAKIVTAMESGVSFRDAMNAEGNGAIAAIFGGTFEAKPVVTTPTVPALMLTPAIRAAVLGGQPLFQGAKGSAEFTRDGKAIIRGLAAADVSTGIHEIAHVARRQLLNREVPTDQRRGITDDDIATAEQWAGAVDGVWSVAAEEKLARGFERYLLDGDAPDSRLRRTFAQFRSWLSEVYQAITGSGVDVDVSPAMRQVFDRLTTRGLPVSTPVRPGPSGLPVTEKATPGPAETPDQIAGRLLKAVDADLAGYVAQYRERFGSVVNGDNASELFPEYVANRSALERPVRPAAAKIVNAVFAEILSEPVAATHEPIAVFTSGGNGSGKSTAAGSDAHVTFDSTLSQFEPSRAKIDQALAAGLDVRIRHTARHPVEAWTDGVLSRAMDQKGPQAGRTVSLNGHAVTHGMARQTLLQLAEHYAGVPGVVFEVRENGSGGVRPRSVDWLGKQRYPEGDDLRAQLRAALEDAYASRRVSPDVYAGAGGNAGGARQNRTPDGRGVREEPRQRRSSPRRADAEVSGLPVTAPRDTGADSPNSLPVETFGSPTRAVFEKPPTDVVAQYRGGRPMSEQQAIEELRRVFAIERTGSNDVLDHLGIREQTPLPTRTGKFRQRAFGIYNTETQAIRLKRAFDLATFTHELGHHIDFALFEKHGRPSGLFKRELLKLGEATTPASKIGQDVKYQMQEGVAEFFRLYFPDPASARKAAPLFSAALDDVIAGEPAFAKQLQRGQAIIQRYLSQDLATRGKARVNVHRTASPGRVLSNAVAAAREGASGVDSAKRVVGSVLDTLNISRAARDPHKAWQGFRKRWVDDLDPIDRAVRDMASRLKGAAMTVAENAYVLARLARGTAGRAQGFLEYGVRDAAGQFLGGSLRDAVTPVMDRLVPDETGKDIRPDLASYLIALRARELSKADRPGGPKDPGMKRPEAEAIIRQMEADPEFDRFAKARDAIYAYQTSLLSYAAGAGVFNADQLAAIAKAGEFYVPLQRVMDEIADAGAGGGTARRIADRVNPVKRLKGSGRDIIDPFESIVKNTAVIVDMVEKNRAMQALTALADKSEGSANWLEPVPPGQIATTFNLGQVKKEVLDQLFKQTGISPLEAELNEIFDWDAMVTAFAPQTWGNPKDRIVTVIRNGKREFYQVQDEALYQAITALGGQAASEIVQWAAKPTAVLRAGATLTPGFIIRNLMRDTVGAMMQSRHGFVPLYDSLRGWLSMLKNDADWQLYMASGVQQATLLGQDRDRLKSVVDQLGEKGWRRTIKTAAHPLDALRFFSEQIENATRVGEFKLALESGGVERRGGLLGIAQRVASAANPRAETTRDSLATATLAARDVTIDFSRGGSTSREINQFKAFFNARAQGYARIAESVARDPMGSALTTGALVALSYALWAINKDDEEYQSLTWRERMDYWWLKLPGNETWLRIPKPHEWGTIPNVMEGVLDQVHHEQKGTAWSMSPINMDRREALGVVAGLAPTFILPALEGATNYDTYRRRNIVSPFDEINAKPADQYTDMTSDTMKRLGRVTGLSPAKLEHIFVGYTATAGRAVLEVSDAVLAGRRKPRPVERRSEQVPISGNVLKDRTATSYSQPIQDFYRERSELQQTKGSFKDRAARGDAAGIESLKRESARFTSEHIARIDAADEALSALRDARNDIYADTTLTPTQRRDALGRIHDAMTRWAATAVWSDEKYRTVYKAEKPPWEQ